MQQSLRMKQAVSGKNIRYEQIKEVIMAARKIEKKEQGRQYGDPVRGRSVIKGSVEIQ